MAAHVPSQELPLFGPYEYPPSDAAGSLPNIIPSPGNILHQYHSHHVETLSPTRDDQYNANGLYGHYDLNSSYSSYRRNETDPYSPYDAPYGVCTPGALRNFDSVPATQMATIPTPLYPTMISSPPVNGTYNGAPTYPLPVLPFASASMPRQAEGPQTTPSGHEHFCRWGTPACGQMLVDGSSATLRAHLRDAHGIGIGTGTNNGRRASARCLWGDECSLKSEHILVSGMAKHIATCHLKSTSLSCASCGQVCSRQDALKRHAQLYCPASKQAEGYKPERRGSQGGGSSQRELGWD